MKKTEKLEEKQKSGELLFPPEPIDEKKEKKKKILFISVWIAVAVLVTAFVLNIFVPPEFHVEGENNITIQPHGEFTPPEAVARYLKIFNISKKIIIESNVNSETPGNYTVKYTLHFHGREKEITKNIKVYDEIPPEITLTQSENLTVSALSLYHEPGFSAFDSLDGDLTDRVTTFFTRDGEKAIAHYSVADNSGNKATAQREFTVKDVIPPVITLEGGEEITVSTANYTEAGFSAFDDLDGDLTDKTEAENDYIKGKLGDFTYRYTVSDKAGNKTQAVRTVHIIDNVAPVIKLSGDEKMYAQYQKGFDDPLITAIDEFDGDVSASVKITGQPDTYTCGKFIVTYTATDTHGNTSSVQRTVFVYKKSVPVDGKVTGNGVVGDNTIFLTFDDGPSSKVTPRVLDILKANGVTATFFIIDYGDSNKYLIERMINEGHTIGIHGYTHDFGVAYASVDAYLNNITTLRQKLIDDFGYETNIIRFLGGSSNAVSKKYCTGIMTSLTNKVVELGYTYFDWNVSSGDADYNNVPSSKIYSNVVNNLKKGRNNIVLMHDTNAKSTTADALQRVIDYGYSNGYTFAGLSSDTTPNHHNVQN